MKKIATVSACIMSWCVLIIYVILFYNVAIAADELVTSIRVIYGGDLNLLLSWLALFLMFILSLVTTVLAVKSFTKKKYYY